LDGSKDPNYDYYDCKYIDYDYMVDSLPRDTLPEGRSWWLDGSKDANYDYMVDCLPRDTLNEGCGWLLVIGDWSNGLRQRLHGRLPPAWYPDWGPWVVIGDWWLEQGLRQRLQAVRAIPWLRAAGGERWKNTGKITTSETPGMIKHCDHFVWNEEEDVFYSNDEV
jgi:hypothetical protein